MWARHCWSRSACSAALQGPQGRIRAARVCKAPTSRISEAQRKFHPGHYVAIGKAQGAKAITKAVEAKGVTGVQLRYRWAILEPRKVATIFRPLRATSHSERAPDCSWWS